MNNSLQLTRDRESLMQQLAKIRRSSVQASERGDFREVARLTLEAARLNRAISETQIKEEAAR